MPFGDVEEGGVGQGGYYGKQQGVGRDVEIEIGEAVGGDGDEGGQSARPDALSEHAMLVPPAPQGVPGGQVLHFSVLQKQPHPFAEEARQPWRPILSCPKMRGSSANEN